MFDPPRSALHKSIIRIGKLMQKHTDVFHVETVLDDNRFPFYLSWVQAGRGRRRRLHAPHSILHTPHSTLHTPLTPIARVFA